MHVLGDGAYRQRGVGELSFGGGYAFVKYVLHRRFSVVFFKFPGEVAWMHVRHIREIAQSDQVGRVRVSAYKVGDPDKIDL